MIYAFFSFENIYIKASKSIKRKTIKEKYFKKDKSYFFQNLLKIFIITKKHLFFFLVTDY